MSIHLQEQADPIVWPETHYLFVEAVGPFAQTAPRAWQEAHQRQVAIAALGITRSFRARFAPRAKGAARERAGFYIEHYRNDPRTTPEAELITEILVPVS